MVSKAIAIIENSDWMLDILLRNLPNDFDHNITFYCFIEDRIGTKPKMIHDAFKRYGLMNYKVVKATEVNEKLKEFVDTEFLDDYTMSTNITAPWYMLKYTDVDKFLVMDDDVYFNEGINEIFESDHSMWISNILLSGVKDLNNENKATQDLFKELFTAFDIETDFSNPFKDQPKYIGSGHFLIVRNQMNLDRYEKALKYFFESETIFKLWKNRNPNRKDFYRYLCIDERFIQCLAWPIANKDLNKYTDFFCVRPNKLTDKRALRTAKKPIVHVCTRTKPELYSRLIELNLIDGDYEDIQNRI